MSPILQPMVPVHGKLLPLPGLCVTTRHGDSPPPSPLLRSPSTSGDSPLLSPYLLFVSPSVRAPPPAPSAPPPRQPSHKRGGREGEEPPAEMSALGKRHHRGDLLSRHTVAHGQSVSRPLPGVPRPVSSAAPSLALPRPPHGAGHHSEPLALRRPLYAAGHHLERSDIQNDRAPRHHVRPRPVTGATEPPPAAMATVSLHVPAQSCGRPVLWNKCIMISKKREVSVAERIGQCGWTYISKRRTPLHFWSRL